MTPGTPRPELVEDPLLAYTRLRDAHQSSRGELIGRRTRTLQLLLATLTGFLLLGFLPRLLPGHNRLLMVCFAAVALLFAFLLAGYLRLEAAIATNNRLLALYATALRRVDGSEPQSGYAGPVPPSTHLYARDLDLFGPDSLFGLLCTVRTTLGERGLADYLLRPASHPETLRRQEAVRELTPRTELREAVALLGANEVQRISATLIDDWLAAPPPDFAGTLRPLLTLTAAAAAVLLRFTFLSGHASLSAVANLVAVLGIQSAICFAVRAQVGPLLAASGRLQQSIRLFAEGLALLDSLNFSSPGLEQLQQRAREPAGAVRELKHLQSLLAIVEQRGHSYFLPLSLLTAAGTQTAISLARWKRAHAGAMRGWLEAWSEFEALNALATFAFEHPADDEHYSWPALLPPGRAPELRASALAHPLLAHAVANEVALDAGTRFYLISGSNMAGKSTLLRAIGINAVLAYAGAPVRAGSFALTPLTMGASLALTDSLAEGRSKFLAEVERLAAIVQLSASQPVLFLVDEIFSGTNSADRRAAAAAVLNQLLANRAIGALSTHDLTLTELVTDQNAGRNVHIASPNPDDPLAFDYTLKPGVNSSSNALAIIRMLGLDAATTDTDERGSKASIEL